MIAIAVPPAGRVVTRKEAEVSPAGTRTVPGTEARPGVSLVRVTIVPPPGAGPVSVTTPIAEPPPARVSGVTRRNSRAVGSTVSVAVRVTPPHETVMTTGVGAVTGAVSTRKAASVEWGPTV